MHTTVELHKQTSSGPLPGTLNVSLLVLLSTQHSGTHFISSVLRSLPDTTFGDEALSQCGVQQCKGLAGKAGTCMRAPTNLSIVGFVRQALPEENAKASSLSQGEETRLTTKK